MVCKHSNPPSPSFSFIRSTNRCSSFLNYLFGVFIRRRSISLGFICANGLNPLLSSRCVAHKDARWIMFCVEEHLISREDWKNSRGKESQKIQLKFRRRRHTSSRNWLRYDKVLDQDRLKRSTWRVLKPLPHFVQKYETYETILQFFVKRAISFSSDHCGQQEIVRLSNCWAK